MDMETNYPPQNPNVSLAMYAQECGGEVLLGRKRAEHTHNLPLCHTEPKTINHALRDCTIVKYVWQHLGQQRLNQQFYSQERRDWLISNANLKAPFNANGIPWNVVFSFAVWLIWKQ